MHSSGTNPSSASHPHPSTRKGTLISSTKAAARHNNKTVRFFFITGQSYSLSTGFASTGNPQRIRSRYRLALAAGSRRIRVTRRLFQSWIVRSFATPIKAAISGASYPMTR